MSTLYYGLSTFGGFVIGIGSIIYAVWFVVDAIYERRLGKDMERRWRELHREWGE